MIEKETALKFLAAGLAVLPADKTLKRPVMAWKNYQEHRPVTADVERWFSDRHNAICLICGKVSGNLEVIDFDQHGELYPAWEAQIPDALKSKLVIERTQSGGFHVAYRCAEVVGGNTELAQGTRRKMINSAGPDRKNPEFFPDPNPSGTMPPDSESGGKAKCSTCWLCQSLQMCVCRLRARC